MCGLGGLAMTVEYSSDLLPNQTKTTLQNHYLSKVLFCENLRNLKISPEFSLRIG
jgi:hypothetical protein